MHPGVKIHMIICSNCLSFTFPSAWVKIFSMQTELNFKINWRLNGMWRLTCEGCLWPLVQTVTSWDHHAIQFDLFWCNNLLYYETVKQAWNKPLLHVYLIYESFFSYRSSLFFLQSPEKCKRSGWLPNHSINSWKLKLLNYKLNYVPQNSYIECNPWYYCVK